MKTAPMNHIKSIDVDFIRARLGNMKASYRFRLAAMTAADNRPGKLWA